MIKVFSEGDKVILDLGGRRRDVLLSPLEAERLADAVGECVKECLLAPPELVKGEVWNVLVTNLDRRVVMRFTSPDGSVLDRVPLPIKAAEAIADLLRTNAGMAGHGMRIQRVTPGVATVGTKMR